MANVEQAQAKLAELIENAQAGNIIPVRLPGQLEEIAALLEEADEDTNDGSPANAGEAGDLLVENAEFVSTAVHELRTPMTSIRGYSDMLNTPTMGELNDMQKQFIDTIRTNAKRMESLLQDVSDIAKIRGGTLKITQKMDMFKNIVMLVEKDTAPMAEEMDKTLTFDIPQGLPLLNTDGEFFAKAIRKLVENALRYTGEDGEVTVRARGEGDMLVVEVEDNGIGMSEDEVAMLGTLYWRADNDDVRAYKGSGLGIPVAYGIIDLLGGKIDVESTPGEGTTFAIRLRGMA
jgi:signal transduction histidine kinase